MKKYPRIAKGRRRSTRSKGGGVQNILSPTPGAGIQQAQHTETWKSERRRVGKKILGEMAPE